ncbi:hypothetical protein AVEN_248591-1 [Araneus ventricosus]|uniref:Uncharacterized protein n=1 Tax=Araneus ventricosus TaxID=182803 RepID=A0A4Y2I117_ARAVE|nr:hypothetical protein AVEN_248591-1 [Araneus ventricosus]
MRTLGYAICPKSHFPSPIQVEKLGTSFPESPKCATVAFRSPSSPTRRISDFPASLRGPNLGKTFVFPLPSQRGPQKAHQAIPIRLQTIQNSKHPIHLQQFSSIFQTDERFFLQCSKSSRMEQW